MTNEDTTDFDEHFAKISSYIVDTLHGVPLEMTEDEREQFRIQVAVYKRQGLGGQAVQTFLLPLDFELGDGQVCFGATALTALYIRVPGIAHIVEESVLQDTVRLLQDWLAALLQDRLSSICLLYTSRCV